MKTIAPLVYVIAFTALIVLGSVGVNRVSNGPNAAVSVPAEIVTDNFVLKLKTHRWELARESLAEDVRARTEANTLRQITSMIEERYGAIEKIQADPGERNGDTAVVTIHVTTSSSIHLSWQTQLKVQNGEWRIASLDGVRRPAVEQR